MDNLEKPLLEVHDVDYLEVEYLAFPVTGLELEYLVRICKPIELTLRNECIKCRIS